MSKDGNMIRVAAVLGAAVLIAAAGAPAFAQESKAPAVVARFHHVHLNTTDPEAAIQFYTAKFKSERQKFAGLRDAVWTGDSWVLFNKVDKAPAYEPVSGIWHIGWGAEDMKSTYQKQLDSGTRFAEPLTDISGMTGAPPDSGRFFFAYVDGPDHALIELNTSGNHNFGHVHMFSANPPATAEWYAANLGVKIRNVQKDPRRYLKYQIAPAAFLTANHVSMIVYPLEYTKEANPEYFKAHDSLAPTRGRVIDHIGFAVDNLDEALPRLRAAGVKVTAEPRAAGPIKFAFIEGPDQVGIELIEDRSPQPAKLPN